MTSLLTRTPPQVQERLGRADAAPTEGRMYAIAFDMDIESLRANYGDPYNNAYLEIRRVLERHGFTWQQGSVYFGGERVNAVTCVLAAIDLSRSLPWFAASVRDIRMLRIEELNDLMPAVQQATPLGGAHE
jgi:virulence-associated protein VapD